MELSDVIPTPDAAPSIRRARVISVAGRNLTVDMGGGIVIPSLDSCNPIPDQWVYIIGEGSSMMAIGAVGGTYRQSTLKVTADGAVSVAGLINGVPTSVSKFGVFTAAVGDVLPLVWAADGSRAWAGAKEGSPTPEPPSGGGSTGGGGGVTSGTATYASTWAGTLSGNGWRSGSIWLDGDSNGGFFYGSSRFRELQGRTITGFRINIARQGGGGAVTLYAISNAGPSLSISPGPSASVTPGGWRSLPVSIANWMISGSGTGGFFIGGSGTLAGLPYGTLQFDWRR